MNKYRTVYSDIKREILTNHYRAGALLPTQQFFTEKYGISRVTLKKALNLLENEGLIYSKQGSGTYVRQRANKTESNLLPLDLPVGVTYSHRDQKISSDVLFFAARLPNEIEQKNLVIDSSEPIYEFKRVRKVNNKVHSYEHVVMPVYIAPINTQLLNESIYDYLGSKKIQLTDAQRILYAIGSSDELSNALNIKKNTPLLVIEQIAYDQKGRAFEYSKSYFPNDKFELNIHLNK